MNEKILLYGYIFFPDLNIKKQFYNHYKILWSKIQNTNTCEELIDEAIPIAINRHPNDKDEIANQTIQKIIKDGNLKDYHHIFEPQCFKNESDEKIIDYI